MKLKITVVVESDDGKSTRTAENGLSLATGIPGIEGSSAKQDFLAQAESIIRSVTEVQLPALYQSVLDAKPEAGAAGAEAPSPAQAAVKAQLDKIRERQNEKQEAQQ